MGRLICAIMDFEQEEFADVFKGESAYRKLDPDEYFWAGEEEDVSKPETYASAEFNGS